MAMKTYGKWIPDHSVVAGYRPVHNWQSHIQVNKGNGPILAPKQENDDAFFEKTLINQGIKWRPQGDSNAERVIFLVHQRQPETIKKHLNSAGYMLEVLLRNCL